MTVPPESTAQDRSDPVAMAVTWLRPVTGPGVEDVVVVPFPSWPPLLSPQQSTVPPVRSAHANQLPATISVTPLRPETATGVDELVVVPSPSSP